MYNQNPMTFLLVDDDVSVHLEYEETVFDRKDKFKIVGMTADSYEAVELVKEYAPEAVLLDLELQKGKGSGIAFLQEISQTELTTKPLVIVITRNENVVVQKAVREYTQSANVAYIMEKNSKGYSAKFVLDQMLALRTNIYLASEEQIAENKITVETIEIRRERIKNRINAELDKIGMPSHLKGRKFIVIGLIYLLEVDDISRDDSVFEHITKTTGRSIQTVSTAISTAIRNVWNNTPIDEIQKHYKQTDYYKSGQPRPYSFLIYYRNKLSGKL